MRGVNRLAVLVAACVCAALLPACSGGAGGGGGGGSGGGGGGGGGGGTSSYTVGGSIAGLTTSGLVLLDNGGNSLSVPANATSFRFTTALANGSAYDVTLQTQPSGETCSTISGSGTINGANVTSIGISCAVNQTIGGSITGLTASGLVLLDNGGNALSVPANATSFQFSVGIPDGGAYAITIQTQPSGQTCSISNGSGTVSGTVANIGVSCILGYTVGGSITGLTASGLVLLDNGAKALSVPGAATSFQFNGALLNGNPYAVTVQTEPTDESCSVSNGSGTISGAVITNIIVSCGYTGSGSNVVPIVVSPGPGPSPYQQANNPLISVTVCQPNSATCVTIDNVLVDTGSSGLRVMKSVLTGAGLTLTPLSDPNNSANTIHECLPFADGYTWGAVASAGVQLAGESAASIPMQVIDDSASPSPAAPAGCTSNGTSLNSVTAFEANGVLGVGLFVQDCGNACAVSTTPNLYYTCTSGGVCSSTVAVADQVVNPVASFATDNNGVIVQLNAVPATGAPSGSGFLVFGINTAANNILGSGATQLVADSSGNFTTVFDNQTLPNSFIDSGSNGLFFPDSSLPTCSPNAVDFYCPGSSGALSAQNLNATNQGTDGTTSNVAFQIANLDYLESNDGSNFALDDIGGPASAFLSFSNYFDWGVPFFYGRTIYFGIGGQPGVAVSYYAY